MEQVTIIVAARAYPTAQKFQQIKDTVIQQYSVFPTLVTTYDTQVLVTVTSDTVPQEVQDQIKQTATDILNAN